MSYRKIGLLVIVFTLGVAAGHFLSPNRRSAAILRRGHDNTKVIVSGVLILIDEQHDRDKALEDTRKILQSALAELDYTEWLLNPKEGRYIFERSTNEQAY